MRRASHISLGFLLIVFCHAISSFGNEPTSPWSGEASTPYSLLTLSSSPVVRDELELTADQVEALAVIRSDRTVRLPMFFRELDTLPIEARRERMRELPKLVREFEDRAREVVLPSQYERYMQIAAQARLKTFSASGGLAESKLAGFLGITNEQKSAIQEKTKKYEAMVKKAREKYQAEIADIAELAKRDVESELTDSQLATLRRLIGKPFTGNIGIQERAPDTGK